jgi:hypothetical protein
LCCLHTKSRFTCKISNPELPVKSGTPEDVELPAGLELEGPHGGPVEKAAEDTHLVDVVEAGVNVKIINFDSVKKWQLS